MTASAAEAHKATLTTRERTTVFALVGAGHTMSHIHMLTLPPLFFLIKDELGISYAALGLLVTVFHVASGSAQVPAGFLVDRFGARVMLTLGMLLSAVSMGAIGLVDSYWAMVALATLSGVGNAVFHPADYAILAAAVDDKHVGKAFSFHLMAGNLGFAVAPVLMVALAALWDWQGALVAIGATGVAVSLAMMAFGGVLRVGDAGSAKKKGGDAAGTRVLISMPILVMLVFFFLIALANSGLQTFAVTALVSMFGVALPTANTALSVFLSAGFVGVAIGGFIADKLKRPSYTVCGSTLLAAAGLALVGATALPAAVLFAAMALSGTAIGVMRPARDMMVNAVTPPGATGKVFGFVGTGLSAGAAIAPVALGWIIDRGAPGVVFASVVFFLLLSVVIAVVVERIGRAPLPAREPAEAAAE